MNRLSILFLIAIVIGLLSSTGLVAQEGAVVVEEGVYGNHGAANHNGRIFRGRFFKRRILSDFQGDTFRYSNVPSARYYDHYDPTLYPKYINGFHSRHFSNIGIPAGDIGLRGNGIYWAPW